MPDGPDGTPTAYAAPAALLRCRNTRPTTSGHGGCVVPLGARQQIRLEAMRITNVRVFESGLEALLRSDGQVRSLAQRAIRVESAAKVYATGVGGGPNVRTGRLRGSITWAIGEDAEGLFARIGSNVEYAIYVEEGTSRMAPRPFLRPALAAGVE